MASRKERKEQLRREREAAAAQAQASARRKRLIAYGVGGLVSLVALAAAVLVLTGGSDDSGGGDSKAVLPGGGSAPEYEGADVAPAAKDAGCELKPVRVRDRNHVQGTVRYPSKPPAGGNHLETPAEDGLYEDPPQTETLVHSLEHGRVVVWFKRNLPSDDRAKLRAYFEDDSYQGLLTPDDTGSKYAVAATAWNRDPAPLGTGRLLGCRRMSDAAFEALAAFRDEHRSNGPEPVP